MKLLTLAAACAAIATLSAAPAFAGETVTAKLQQPVASKVKLIAGGAMFVCESDVCVATSPTSQTFATDSCKAVAAKVGPIAAFTGGKAMDDTRLAACNSVAVARAAGPQVANK